MQENRPIPLFDDILTLNNDNLAEKWIEWLNDYEKFSETIKFYYFKMSEEFKLPQSSQTPVMEELKLEQQANEIKI